MLIRGIDISPLTFFLFLPLLLDLFFLSLQQHGPWPISIVGGPSTCTGQRCKELGMGPETQDPRPVVFLATVGGEEDCVWCCGLHEIQLRFGRSWVTLRRVDDTIVFPNLSQAWLVLRMAVVHWREMHTWVVASHDDFSVINHHPQIKLIPSYSSFRKLRNGI